MKKISAVILNWNSWQETFECFDTVLKSIIKNFKLLLLLIDNASSNIPIQEITDYKRSFKKKNIEFDFIQNSQNLGFAEGNNIGIKKALSKNADYIILLNNDVLVDPYLFYNLYLGAEKSGNNCILGPKIYFAKGFEYHKKRYKEEELGKVIWYAGGIIDWQNVYCSHRGVDEIDNGQYNEKIETDFVSGCCMLIPRIIFEKIGFFDEKYFLYLEDVDFCQRATKAGFKICYFPKAVLWHKNAQSSERPGSKLHQYYQTRNRLLFGFKYGSMRAKMALFKESLLFLRADRTKKKAVIDFFTGKFGKGQI